MKLTNIATALMALLMTLGGCSVKSTIPTVTTYNVVNNGADPTGLKDSTIAIRKTLAAAEQTPGNTVWFPAGTYILDDNDGLGKDFQITTQVNIEGDGNATTKIIEEIGAKKNLKSKTIFQIQADGTMINGLTLDAHTYDAGTPIIDFANNTDLFNLTVFGPRSTPSYNSDQFGMRVIAVCNHANLDSVHHSDNVIHDVSVTSYGGAGNTDIDLSCQEDDNVYNVVDTGNGMDLYIVKNVQVNNFQHHDNASGQHSIVITAPSSGVDISNFQTWGSGGQIEPSPNGYESDVKITNETMYDLTQHLAMGDGLLSLNHSTLGTIKINAVKSAIIQLNQTTFTSVICPTEQPITMATVVSCS